MAPGKSFLLEYEWGSLRKKKMGSLILRNHAHQGFCTSKIQSYDEITIGWLGHKYPSSSQWHLGVW